MINPSNSQLLFNSEINRDINEKILLVKNNNSDSNLREKQAREVFYSIAHKINKCVEKNNITELNEILAERSRFQEEMQGFDWPVLDKKTLENFAPHSNFYYEAIRNHCLISKTKSSQVAEGVFKYYLHFIEHYATNYNQRIENIEKTAKKESDLEREKNKDSDKVEDKEKEKEEKEKHKEIEKEIEKEKNNEMILNEQIIFYLFNDYVESYRSLLLKLYSEKKDKETIQDIKDLFWEMPNLAFEELSFSQLDISTVNTKEVKLREGNIKNLFLLSVLISTFKAVLIESSIEKVTFKESFIKALSQNTQNSRLSKLSEYFELMKSTYPLFYLESVILLTVSGFLTNQSPSEKDFKIWLVELLRAWEFSSTYSKFLRRSNDLKSLSSNYSESIRSLVILILIACYKNLYSNSVKQVLEFVDLDSRFYETSNLESVLLGLRVPTVSEFNDTPVKIIIEKVRGVIRSNQEVNSNSSSQQVEIEKEILSIIN